VTGIGKSRELAVFLYSGTLTLSAGDDYECL